MVNWTLSVQILALHVSGNPNSDESKGAFLNNQYCFYRKITLSYR